MTRRTWFGRVPATARASRWASAGLAMVLLALALVATAGSWYEARMIKLATASMAIGDASRDARFLATAEKGELSRAYMSGRAQEARVRHAEIGQQLDTALHQLQGLLGMDPGVPAMDPGTPDTDVDDRSKLARLLARQREYSALADRFFDLLDTGNAETAAGLFQREIDPLAEQLAQELDRLARMHYAMNMMHADRMNKASRLLQVGTPLVFGVGLLLFTLLAMITRSHRRNVEARARQDPLTGLPNRTAFHDRTEQAMRNASRTGAVATVLILDLDGFKDVNDSLGHYYGDQLLIEVATRLRAVVRTLDTVARLGGDEFAVLLDDEGAGTGGHIAQRIAAALHTTFVIDNVSLDIEASIGIATVEPGQDVVTVIRHADTAMYLAKENKLGFAHFDPEHDKHTGSRLALLGALRKALDTDQIVLHYQPKMTLDTGEMTGVEALARWQHPTRGLLGPADFIPVLESTSLSHRFTAYVLEQALKQARMWLDQGFRMSVAVNVSTRCLLDPQFPDSVARLLAITDVPGELLCIEITENTVMADPPQTIDTLRRVRELGVKTAIDDFGTGYSSMAYLNLLPVDELKVDQSFVTDMTTNQNNSVLVQSAVDLGHNLGLTVVAEGVEDAATLDALHRLGCDVAQGYYFARPQPAHELTDMMQHHANTRLRHTHHEV